MKRSELKAGKLKQLKPIECATLEPDWSIAIACGPINR
jgi:hypothetical protein